MMVAFFLFGGLLLAWAFGRNNFSNVFGSAVGTGILSFRFAALLTASFLLLGALLNGSGTSEVVSSLWHFTSLMSAFCFSVIIAIMMLFLTKCGIPASVAQLSIGGMIGWNLALGQTVVWENLFTMIWGWFFSPLIACFFAFLIFKIIRFYLKKHPVPILYRDMWVRLFWGIVGSFTAYSLGANNLAVLTIPFTVGIDQLPVWENTFITGSYWVPILFSLAAGMGCLMASRRVIKMVSSKLFPLSSVESLIVGFSGALTLFLFSFQNGVFPALPISMSAALIGAIVGVSLGKGGYGLKIHSLFSIVISWILSPFISGLLCFCFLYIIGFGRF